MKRILERSMALLCLCVFSISANAGGQPKPPSDPKTASLGDRVWVDNGDGVQDCLDRSGGGDGDGILGNDGDSGDECGAAGVDGVEVTLLAPGSDGSCGTADDELLQVTTTASVGMSMGFYKFENLMAGQYCIAWKKPAGFDCTAIVNWEFDSDGVDLGNGMCVVDELITLGPGDNDLTWDLGLVPTPPATVSLGDRVWEDLDGDGVQDCSDTSGGGDGDGILGNAGDSGAECGAGIPNVPVNLFMTDGNGNCSNAMAGMTTTDGGGFYLFENLQAGSYCVEFGLPADDFCDTGGFDLGAPQFTAQNAGGDVVDSDADVDSGRSDAVTLMAGDTDRTVDAGVVCPAKIGNFVWSDDNENGIQDSGEPGVQDVTATLVDCGIDMMAGTSDDMLIGQSRTTDSDGMYMFGAEPGVYDLPPGKYFVQFSAPDGRTYTEAGQGGDAALDSNCGPTGLGSCVTLGSRGIDLTQDCGLLPPPLPTCDLTLDKQCRVDAPPPSQDFDKCSGKLQQFTLVWTGAGSITATGPNNSADLNNGDEATFVGPFDDNDVIVDISGAVSGQSTFHVSCSDDNFNDPSDCGKMAGDGKNDDGGINAWQLAGFIDGDGRVLDCSPGSDGEGFSDNCTYEPQPLPSCENGEKPDNLTWRYDGGTGGDGNCADSTFSTITDEDGKTHDDFECSGNVNTALQIMAMDDDGNTYQVNPGESFTTPRDAISEISITDTNMATQSFAFHSSCSQPLQAGATAGALTLVALDDRDGAQDVTYRYTVTNSGDALINVGIEDDLLGTIASGKSLGDGGSATFDVMTEIFGTTMNTAQASGTFEDGAACSPGTASDSVMIEAVAPPCSIGVELYKVEDDKLKIKLTNNGSSTVTMNDLEVSFPQARGDVEKVKLDGDAYKRGDSSMPVNGTPASFGLADWTEDEVKKRQIKPGDTEKLEIEFTDKSSKNGRFEIMLDFGDGCVIEVIVENQQLLKAS